MSFMYCCRCLESSFGSQRHVCGGEALRRARDADFVAAVRDALAVDELPFDPPPTMRADVTLRMPSVDDEMMRRLVVVVRELAGELSK